jgi:hypothetical protein
MKPGKKNLRKENRGNSLRADAGTRTRQRCQDRAASIDHAKKSEPTTRFVREPVVEHIPTAAGRVPLWPPAPGFCFDRGGGGLCGLVPVDVVFFDSLIVPIAWRIYRKGTLGSLFDNNRVMPHSLVQQIKQELLLLRRRRKLRLVSE